MRIIVLASRKGGSGKTTLAGHLAVQAELSGAGPVALVDADPQGSLADWWNLRTAAAPSFVQARLEPGQLGDDMLPRIGWSWLTDALEHAGAGFTALGGTVTQTSSVRFGGLSGGGGGPGEGPPREDDVELRASWSPTESDGDLSRHAVAFASLVSTAAGLPPVGAVPLSRSPG